MAKAATTDHRKKNVSALPSAAKNVASTVELPSKHAKTARGKRFLESREPQVVESIKRALFIRSSTSSLMVNSVLHDLWALKKPHGALHMHRNKGVRAWDEGSASSGASLEFFAQKEDAAFAFVASHSKKRPHHLTMVRFFDGQIMEQCELAVKHFRSIAEFSGAALGVEFGVPVGVKPVFAFNGPAWTLDANFKRLQNMLLGCFIGQETVSEIDLKSALQVCISFSVLEDASQTVAMRVHRIALKKSGTHVPSVRLHEVGPALDFTVGRTRWASEELQRQATETPRELAPRKTKNIEKDAMGSVYGRVHVGQQDLGKLQIRKMKALKKDFDGQKMAKSLPAHRRPLQSEDSGDASEDGNFDKDEE